MSIFNTVKLTRKLRIALGQKLYLRLIYDGTTAVIQQRDLVDMLPEDRSEWKDYTIESVWMTEAEFEALPDFQGY